MASNSEQYDNFLDGYLNQPNADVTPAPIPKQRPSLPAPPPPAAAPVVEQKQPRAMPGVPDFQNHFASKKHYEVIEIEHMPHGAFYRAGTKIEFRECDAFEIEGYSMLDVSSLTDFKDKIFEIIQACVRVTNPDGTVGSAADVQEGDRQWLVLLIREKTFVSGTTLSVGVAETVDGETKTHQIDVLRANLEYYDPTAIMKHYAPAERCLVFETTLQDEPIRVAPPTIGLKRCFEHYLRLKIEGGTPPEAIHTPFFKFAPYLLPQASYISYEELEQLEEWFARGISAEYYAFIYDLITHHLTIGVKGLKKKVGERELRTRQVYPARLETLFVLPHGFDLFLKK